MKITRTSPHTGVTQTRDLPVTEEQFARYNAGEMIQVAFPHLSAGDREFIRTGYTDEDWDDMFPEEER